MATHSSILTWIIPGTGEPGGLLSMGSHTVRHDWNDLAAAAAAMSNNLKEKESQIQETEMVEAVVSLNSSPYRRGKKKNKTLAWISENKLKIVQWLGNQMDSCDGIQNDSNEQPRTEYCTGSLRGFSQDKVSPCHSLSSWINLLIPAVLLLGFQCPAAPLCPRLEHSVGLKLPHGPNLLAPNTLANGSVLVIGTQRIYYLLSFSASAQRNATSGDTADNEIDSELSF